jgi:hypothetical protein
MGRLNCIVDSAEPEMANHDRRLGPPDRRTGRDRRNGPVERRQNDPASWAHAGRRYAAMPIRRAGVSDRRVAVLDRRSGLIDRRSGAEDPVLVSNWTNRLSE